MNPTTDPAAQADLTVADLELAHGYLAETAKGVSQAIQDLNEEQWTWKPSPDRWSIAEILEHLALLEESFERSIVPRLREAAPAASGRNVAKGDARVRTLVPDRSAGGSVKSPPHITPTGAWAPAESLDRYRRGRGRTAEFLQSSKDELRTRVMEHPGLGPLDGYQWILFLAAHSVRHTRQILELKADPGFPAWGPGYFAGPSETTEFSVER
jgi:uncharacterized damage-inducible protein DinB